MDPQAILDNFKRTITDHYFDFRGRAGRAQFWYFVLAYVVVAIGVAVLQAITFLPLIAILNLALLLPATGIGARRLQDTGRDGKIMWLYLIVSVASLIISLLSAIVALAVGWLSFLMFGPLIVVINLAIFIGGLVLIWFWCQPGDPGPNAYGPPPVPFDPSRPASPAA